MKKYALYNPNKMTAKLVGSKALVDTVRGSQFTSLSTDDDLIKPDFDSYKNSHVIELEINEETNTLDEVEFVNIAMSHINIGKNRYNERLKEKGISLKESSGRSIAVILRATDSISNTFKPMDYVILVDKLPKSADINSAKDELLDLDDANSGLAKRLVWTGHHAQSMAVSYDREHHVIASIVNAKDVFMATNSDEYFYDGNIKEGKVILSFDELGQLKESAPSSTKEHSL